MTTTGLPARIKANPIAWADGARALIAKCDDLSQAQEMDAQAAAAVAFFEQKLGRLSGEAMAVAAVRLLTRRRIGELLPAKMHRGGKPDRGSNPRDTGIALTSQRASDARALAEVPAAELDDYIEEQREAGQTPSVAGALKRSKARRRREEIAARPAAEACPLSTVKGPFDLILADPPWSYQSWSQAKQGAAVAAYPTLGVEEICELPVGDLAAEDCALLLWSTWPKLQEALRVLEAWGFRYVTCAFVWNKTYADGSPYCGLGFYTRSGSEFCLLGLRGKMPRESASVRQVLSAPVAKHSAKPHEVYDRINELWPDATNRIELFARTPQPGWAAWGDEV